MADNQNEKNHSNKRYPSAELLQQACYDDYSRLRNTYDFIYNKVQIALAFSTALLVVVIQNIEIKGMLNIIHGANGQGNRLCTIASIASILSVVTILAAIIMLLLLSKSKPLVVFDSNGIRTEKVYNEEPNDAALWLIAKYTTAAEHLKATIDEKQKQFDCVIWIIIASIIFYIVSVIIKKGA